jgi:hypothetical protein
MAGGGQRDLVSHYAGDVWVNELMDEWVGVNQLSVT